jgi:hypothetical protein
MVLTLTKTIWWVIWCNKYQWMDAHIAEVCQRRRCHTNTADAQALSNGMSQNDAYGNTEDDTTSGGRWAMTHAYDVAMCSRSERWIIVHTQSANVYVTTSAILLHESRWRVMIWVDGYYLYGMGSSRPCYWLCTIISSIMRYHVVMILPSNQRHAVSRGTTKEWLFYSLLPYMGGHICNVKER